MGSAFEVYNTLGPGFLESVYHEALEIELDQMGIPYLSQSPVNINYKGNILNKTFLADLICYENIIIEIKAQDSLITAHEAQLLNYLKATGLAIGLLINFGHSEKLQWKRFVM